MDQRRVDEVRHDLHNFRAHGALPVEFTRERDKIRSFLAAVDDAGIGRTEVDELRPCCSRLDVSR